MGDSKELAVVEVLEGELLNPFKVDKAEWGDGPWQEEPDTASWFDMSSKYSMNLVRNPSMGNWCGYVGIPKKHPYYGHGYDDHWDLECHGGLTYASHFNCLTQERDKYWWFGFDAAHAYDLVPGMNALYKNLPSFKFHKEFKSQDVYRDEFYMKSECQNLSIQLYMVERDYKANKMDNISFHTWCFLGFFYLYLLDFSDPWWMIQFNLCATVIFILMAHNRFKMLQKFKEKYL